jgi:IS605 OrfB family transposase
VTYLGNTYRLFGTKRRPLPETAKGGCFVEDARGHWWVCLRVEVTERPQAPDHEVGIDLGLKHLAALSSGIKIEAPKYYYRYEDKLASAQRAGNKEHARALNAKIANCRRDYAHKWTTWVARSFRDIFLGDVSSSQLARTTMAKAVYDAGWGMSKQFLRYKASRHGGSCEDVSEKFTTQICSTCGGLPPERPRGIAGLRVRQWECSLCGAIHDRDVNAAKNILIAGLSARLKKPSVDREISRQPPVEESRLMPVINLDKHGTEDQIGKNQNQKAQRRAPS